MLPKSPHKSLSLAALLVGAALASVPALAQEAEDRADARARELHDQIRAAAQAGDWEEYGELWGELGQQIGESVADSLAEVDWEEMASHWAALGAQWGEMGARIGESFADVDWEAWAEQWEDFGERMEASFDSDDWRDLEREMERLGETLDTDVAATVEAALESVDWDSLGALIEMSIESALAGLDDIDITVDSDDDGLKE